MWLLFVTNTQKQNKDMGGGYGTVPLTFFILKSRERAVYGMFKN